MASGKVVLWQNAMAMCPFAQRPQVALAAKGIDYDLKKVACAKGEPKDPKLCALFAELSPGGASANVTVPLMEHEVDGKLFRMIESGPCSEYIDEVWKDSLPLWPNDPKQRFAVRMFLDTAGSAGFIGPLFWNEWPEKIAEHVPKLKLVNACLEKYATPDGDLLLDQISMAEVMIGTMIQRWKHIGEIRGFNGMKLAQDLGLERFCRWVNACVNHPALVSTFPEEFVEKVRRDAKPVKISYDIVDGNVTNIKSEAA